MIKCKKKKKKRHVLLAFKLLSTNNNALNIDKEFYLLSIMQPKLDSWGSLLLQPLSCFLLIHSGPLSDTAAESKVEAGANPPKAAGHGDFSLLHCTRPQRTVNYSFVSGLQVQRVAGRQLQHRENIQKRFKRRQWCGALEHNFKYFSFFK